MAYPRHASHPEYSGKFIPEIWSGQLIKKFYETTVLKEITNTKYEGEISNYGDKVIIRTTPTLTIRDYVAGGTLTYERPETTTIELLIDKGKYFGFEVDDVMAYQSDINLMETFSTAAAEQMKIEIDRHFLGSVYPDAHAKNRGTAAGNLSGNINLGSTSGLSVAVTKDNILKKIVEMGQCLDELNIPGTGRFIVAPVWFVAILKDSKLIEADTMGDQTSVLRTGVVGTIDRFRIIQSNLLPTMNDTATPPKKGTVIYFGTTDAACFATQLTKTDTLRSPQTFGDIVRGLQVYGFKVIQPECLGVLFAHAA